MCARKQNSLGAAFLLLGWIAGNLCFQIIGCSRPGCSNPLGLEGRAKDSQFSSYTFKDGWYPYLGRLNNDGAWCSDTNDKNHEFLQIDQLHVQHISRIDTQGVRGSYLFLRSYYVITFVIEYSYDGATWFTYKGSGGSVQTFHGNSDHFSVKNNFFRDTFVTRYLRIYPKTFNHCMCLRVELYGCNDHSDCSTYITTASGSINSLSFPGSYPANKDCTWLIEVSKDKNISLMFVEFDVYQGSNPGSCNNDYVEVRDGLTDSSPVIGGKYCNQNRAMLITTNNNVARIYFHSGVANLGHKGFQLYFLSVTKGSDDVLSGTACDGEVLALDCSGYQNTINILHASYHIGSFPFSCGLRHNYSSSTSCPTFDALGVIVSKCQDYKKCLITVSESSFPVQSCERVRHQLEVFYQCNSTNVKTPSPTPQLKTNTASAGTEAVSLVPSNTHMSHSLNSHVTESPTEVNATETSRSTDLITEVTSTRRVDTTVGRRKNQMTTVAVVLVIVVVIIAVVIIAALLFCRWKKKRLPCRQRRDKKDALPAVEFHSDL